MFNDILESRKEPVEKDRDSIIKGLRYEVKKKDEIIKNLFKQITLLEKQVERLGSQ